MTQNDILHYSKRLLDYFGSNHFEIDWKLRAPSLFPENFAILRDSAESPH